MSHAFSSAEMGERCCAPCRAGSRPITRLVEEATDEFGKHYRFMEESVPALSVVLDGAGALYRERASRGRAEPNLSRRGELKTSHQLATAAKLHR